MIFFQALPVRKIIFLFIGYLFFVHCSLIAQNLPEPTDYLSKEFHKQRREAARNLMPENSVIVIFSYPERVFSQDVNYVYHQNPDLYYFSGYKEPNAVLLIFKEMQHSDAGDYNELFFVQKRDPLNETWTGKRLGVEGTRIKLGFDKVYVGEEFERVCPDLSKFNIIYDDLPDDIHNDGEEGGLYNLFAIFMLKAHLSTNENKQPSEKIKNKTNTPDKKSGSDTYKYLTNSLREIKTPEEIALIRKSVSISAIAHAEVMKAIQPDMSERELEGIFSFVHKKYGAEEEGYGPIVGAGANGCILHYEENSVTNIKSQMVVMDVAAEYHGYSADVTRTVPATGKFSLEEKTIYQMVYDAQEEIFKLCKDGMPFGELNKKAKQVLAIGLMKAGIIKDAKEVDIYYPHGCSHHMGLDVHDKSNYGPLKENMVITVEPGIYIPAGSNCDKKWWNIGVRIEDDVIIGKDKCELLSSQAPRKWEDVEKMTAQKSVLNNLALPSLQ
jgi:Xaa-Pro aminopeptidase